MRGKGEVGEVVEGVRRERSGRRRSGRKGRRRRGKKEQEKE